MADFGSYLPLFEKIIPHDYKRMIEEIAAKEAKGLDSEQAKIEAFYALVKEEQ